MYKLQTLSNREIIMRSINTILLLAGVLFLSSCYHAQITTGKQMSNQVIDKPWAHSFIFGLVPPNEVSVAEQCENGVAKVETQISFLNGLVSAITFNIYTPMQITVTCAAGSGMSELDGVGEDVTVSEVSSSQDVIKAVEEASKRAVALDKPVYIHFR